MTQAVKKKKKAQMTQEMAEVRNWDVTHIGEQNVWV